MNTRYMDIGVKFLMYRSSFLDLRFKTLTHLSTTLQDEIFDCALDECVDSESVSDCEIQIESISESHGLHTVLV